MNGHSLDETSSDTERTKPEKVAENKDGESKAKIGKRITRKMSNGKALDKSDIECSKDKDTICAIDTEAKDMTDESNNGNVVNNEANDSCDESLKCKNDSIDDLADKSDSVSDLTHNVKDKCDNVTTAADSDDVKDAVESDDVKDKSDNSITDITDDIKDGETNSVKEVVAVSESDKNKNGVLDQNGSATSDAEQTSTKTSKPSPVKECEAEIIADDDDGSDIEMIEESDPLAISDVDVKLAREEKMKKDSSLIIIDTNSILKTATGLTVTGVKSVPKRQPKAAPTTSSLPAISVGNMNVNSSIQSALQAIASAGHSGPGLQTAYATAIQQALLNQALTNPQAVTNPQYVSQLQQCYSSLREVQDEAYVIEAPSFIVPYVMEGKPKETIKEYLDKLKKEDAKEKAQKEKEKSIESKKEEEKTKCDKKEDKKSEDLAKESKSESSEKGDESTSDDKDEAMSEGEEKKDSKSKDNESEEMDADDEMEVDSENVKTKKSKKNTDEKDKSKDDKDSTQPIEDDEEYKPEVQPESESENEDEGSKKGDESKDDSDKENSKSDVDEVIDLDKEEKHIEDLSHLGKWEPFYQSSLGKFFMDLGLNQVEEFIQNDIVKMTRRKLEKMKTNPTKQDFQSLKIMDYQLKKTRKKNSYFKVEVKTCKHCTFKTESELVMSKHLEAPHMANYTYRCNFCEYETRGPQSILFHMEAIHGVKGRLERAPAFFQCPLCPFEENTKSKMTRHAFSCCKRYKPEKNCEILDWEPPAKIIKMNRGRAHAANRGQEAVKLSGIFTKAFAGMNVPSNMMTGAGPIPFNARGRGRPVGSYKNLLPLAKNPGGAIIYPSQGGTARFINSFSGANSPHQLSLANHVLQSVNNKSGSTKLPQQPSISITPLVRAEQVGKNGATSKEGGKPTFVICEICDGYIKDLEQLRIHMNNIHKVKIHPKMIYNRPPLNCQKCQQRFFTDQGLERHLLGTHGLVTSSMQEAANKGKDSGRCPICGKVFQWKLLNHVSRDHKLTLKPAHLSYKCTVCTATFNMYRLFENHVYSAHSVVNKNKAGGDSSSSNSKKPSGSDAAPLKINDEITIIPQPSSKAKTESGKSSKSKDTTPSVSKEITITKVGGSPRQVATKKGGVEIISLDESPVKRQLDEPKKRSLAKRQKVSQ